MIVTRCLPLGVFVTPWHIIENVGRADHQTVSNHISFSGEMAFPLIVLSLCTHTDESIAHRMVYSTFTKT